MEGDLADVVRATEVKLLLGSGGVEAVDIQGIFPGVDKLFQPTAPGLVADIFKREFRWVVETDKGPVPLAFVIVYDFSPGEVGVEGGAIDALSVSRFGGYE